MTTTLAIVRSVPALVLLLVLLVAPGVSARPSGSAGAAHAAHAAHATLTRLSQTSGAATTSAAAIRGVSVTGSEYACIGDGTAAHPGWGYSERPVDAALVSDLEELHATHVRLPLNEDCYLGINATSAYTGAGYRAWLQSAVDTLTGAGLSVILDLHWTAPGGQAATRQASMPDADHSPAFWRAVATQFAGNPHVLFEAFNEPVAVSNGDSDQNWACWRDGGAACPGRGYQAAGMQALVDAIRATGATQPIIVNGIGYAQIMTQYLAYLPHDPLNNLMAGVHPGGWCPDAACWEREYAPIAAVMPLIATEVYDHGTLPVDPHGAIYTLLDWLDAHGAGELAWVDNTWGNGETLRNGDGSLASWGWLWRAHTRASLGLAGPAVVDGGFESGWAGANSLYFGAPSIVPYAAHTGGHAEQLSAANDGVGQALGGLTPGAPVTATVWATNKVTGQSTCLAFAGAAQAPACTSSSSYTQLTTTYTPTTSIAVVLAYKASGFDASWVDDLNVTMDDAATRDGRPTVTATPTAPAVPPSDTPTATATATATISVTATATNTPTATQTFVPTNTATPTGTATATPTGTATITPRPTPDLRATVTAQARLIARYRTVVAVARTALAGAP